MGDVVVAGAPKLAAVGSLGELVGTTHLGQIVCGQVAGQGLDKAVDGGGLGGLRRHRLGAHLGLQVAFDARLRRSRRQTLSALHRRQRRRSRTASLANQAPSGLAFQARGVGTSASATTGGSAAALRGLAYVVVDIADIKGRRLGHLRSRRAPPAPPVPAPLAESPRRRLRGLPP